MQQMQKDHELLEAAIYKDGHRHYTSNMADSLHGMQEEAKVSRKEELAAEFQEAQLRAAQQNYILKGPKPETHSATMPAYCFTTACPDPELRESLGRGKNYGKRDIDTVQQPEKRVL